MAEFLASKPYHLQPSTLLERFEILGVVGQGGFALTYLAVDKQLEREVIIKEYFPSSLAQRDPDGFTVIPTDEESFADGLESFYQEALSLSQLQHPNIADVISVIRQNDTAYMVMPYYAGTDLEVHLEMLEEPLSEQEAFEIIQPILRALDYIHNESVIHRDIKPANILLAKRGSHNYPVLIDFGGARQFVADVTQNYTQLLSLGYAPFEQYFKDGKQGPWTDIYACAGVLYRMITGERPPDATERKAGKPLDLSSFSPTLAPVMNKALTEDYGGRYQTVTEFEKDFEAALKGASVPNKQAVHQIPASNTQVNQQGISQQEPSQQAVPPQQQNTGCLKPLLIAFGIFLVLGAVGAGVWWQFFRTRTYTADTAAKLERYVMEAKSGSTIKVVGDLSVQRTLDVTQELSIEKGETETARVTSSGAFPLIRLNSNEPLTLTGLSLGHTGADAANVIEILRGQLVVQETSIEGAIYDGIATGGRGILLSESGQLNLTNSVFQGNGYAGIEANGASTLRIDNTTFERNDTGLILGGTSQSTVAAGKILESTKSGVVVRDNAKLSLNSSNVEKSGAHGISLEDGGALDVVDSLIFLNRAGIFAKDSSTVSITGSTVSQHTEPGLFLKGTSRATAQGNIFENNFAGIYAQEEAVFSQTDNQFSSNENGDTVP